MAHFDLNIDTILEAWTVADALREVVANALDEQALSDTPDVEIVEVAENRWRIRDCGRGLRVEHFTQNESEEKLTAEGIIGRFGVGLKDALATLDRHDVRVTIRSNHGTFRPMRAEKHGFEDLETLHVDVAAPPEGFTGTEFVLEGLQKADVEQAKSYFLRFSGERVLEETRYGQVLERGEGPARIYVNGVRVAEEEDMLFSYNVTSLTAAMKKALNRERTHVGRSAYSGRLKDMLLACESYEVATRLVDDLQRYAAGDTHDELGWIDVQAHACALLNSVEPVVFSTAAELDATPDSTDRAKRDGYRLVVVPEALSRKINGQRDASGQPIRTVARYEEEFNDSFSYTFVHESELSPAERNVWSLRERVLRAVGGAAKLREVAISETMRLDEGFEAMGVWEPKTGRIVIRRDQLENPESFTGTLLHELAHARSGASDLTRAFEGELTVLLGMLAAQLSDAQQRC